MFKVLKVIGSLAKRLDEHLSRGVEQHGRHLAGLKPAGRRATRNPVIRPKHPRTERPAAQFRRLGSLAR